MAYAPMPSSKKKVLMNAEAFGFGPTAAIASFFPQLRGAVETLAYIGEGHSLDLQRPLPYDALYNCTTWRPAIIKAIMERYDVFITACDFGMADLAKQAGLEVIIYDPLTWFWRDMPEAAKSCDLYLAQNFLGVRKALQGYLPHMQGAASIVPPILQGPQHVLRQGDEVLINFGGLLNPFWDKADAIHYASHIYNSIMAALPKGVKPIVCASSAIARALPHMNAKSYPRAEMLRLMAKSKLAFMTSGLGNIYDAAQFNLPTVWLPPTNDSQGQQLQMIVAENMVDHHLDWGNINYYALQAAVMAELVNHVRGLDAQKLNAQMAKAYKHVAALKYSQTAKLTERFGVGGAAAVANHVLAYLNGNEELDQCA